MSIKINNFEIINNGSELAIDVETNVDHNITSILLWTMDNFKDYTLAIDLSDKLLNINNKEVLIIKALDYQLLKFEDICFIEVESDYIEVDVCTTDSSTTLGITYNFSVYYNCLMNSILEMAANDCLTCEDKPSNKMIITINMMIDSIEKALEVGYYTQAVQMISKLKKLCSIKACTNCPTIECPACNKFKQH